MASRPRKARTIIPLSDIIENKRCSPLTLTEFAHYLTYAEDSVRNLQFHLWYTSFRQRWLDAFELEVDQHLKRFDSPSSSPTDQGSRPSVESPHSSPTSVVGHCDVQPPQYAFMDEANTFRGGLAPLHPPNVLLAGFPGRKRMKIRNEVASMIDLYIRPGSPRDLRLADSLQLALTTLVDPDPFASVSGKQETTTFRPFDELLHPDAFKAADEVVLKRLESRSLLRYLELLRSNINEPKKFFWYAIGVLDLALGLAIAILCIVFVHSRWWRLFGLPLIYFGLMQIFSAYKGFCSMLHRRKTRQLWPWELSAAIAGEPGEKERQNIHEDSTRVFNGKRSTSSFFAAVHSSEPPGLDADPGSAQRISNSGFCSEQHISIPDSHSGTGAGPDKIFVRRSHRRRAKAHIFGPEKVIGDDYVLQMQDSLLNLILTVGLLGALVLIGVLVAIPESM